MAAGVEVATAGREVVDLDRLDHVRPDPGAVGELVDAEADPSAGCGERRSDHRVGDALAHRAVVDHHRDGVLTGVRLGRSNDHRCHQRRRLAPDLDPASFVEVATGLGDVVRRLVERLVRRLGLGRLGEHDLLDGRLLHLAGDQLVHLGAAVGELDEGVGELVPVGADQAGRQREPHRRRPLVGVTVGRHEDQAAVAQHRGAWPVLDVVEVAPGDAVPPPSAPQPDAVPVGDDERHPGVEGKS